MDVERIIENCKMCLELASYFHKNGQDDFYWFLGDLYRKDDLSRQVPQAYENSSIIVLRKMSTYLNDQLKISPTEARN